MAMEGLGRLFNVVPIAAGVAIALRDVSGVTFVCTGADTFTLTVADSFGGAYATPGTIITRKHTNTATNGTAAWVYATQAAADAVTIGAGAVVFYVDAKALPDTKTYIKCTQSAAGLVTAITHDLDVQRKPTLLPKMSA